MLFHFSYSESCLFVIFRNGVFFFIFFLSVFNSQIWSLTRGTMLRTTDFPAIVDAVALDPGEHVFNARCRDSKLYIAALNAVSLSGGSHASHILGSLSYHR